MSRNPKFDRARRNSLKAAGLILGTILANGVALKQASAQPPSGGPPVMAPPPPKPGSSCFAQGAQIRTRAGYRPIETLAVGDEVAVRSGGFAPIKAMVGHTLNRIDGKWNSNPDNLPVIIRRGALGDNVPNADLCVTALHGVYIDGFLVKAGDLVNGTSILFRTAEDRNGVGFINIVLEGHDILDVQGASFESFYRSGAERCAPQLGFDGGRSKLRSHMRSVASVVIDRRQPIDIIRDRLEERGLDFARAA